MSRLVVQNLQIDAATTNGTKNIVDDLSFKLTSGQTLAIVGQSGGGKTMTALAIAGLLPDNCYCRGKILFDDTDILHLSNRELRQLRGKSIQYLPQSGQEYLNPSLTIGRQILAGIKHRQQRRAIKQQALQLFEQYGLSPALRIWKSYPHKLSGGQAQRVMLAMAALAHPQLIIADEPTKGVDAQWAKRWIGELRQMFGQAMIIMITHDIEIASCADQILVVYDGQTMQYGYAKDILQGGHPYTDNLISALPNNGMHVSNVTNATVYNACRYSAKCQYACARCANVTLNKVGTYTLRRCVL